MNSKFLNIFASILCICCAIVGNAQITADQCQGSLGPYPVINQQVVAPDSLAPIKLIHVGRHGSRFPAGPYSARTMLKALNKADSLKTLTPLGMEFKRLVENIVIRSIDRWGALDSLGMQEQRGIARRTIVRCNPLFQNAQHITAIASHSPRAVMSMYSFLHEVSKMVKGVSVESHTGNEFNALVRPFETDSIYRRYMKEKPYSDIYNDYVTQHAPNTVTRLLGTKYPAIEQELKELSIIEYYNIANMKAMGMTNLWQPYLSLEEYECLWSCFNLRQYFMHCDNYLSSAPANIAKGLLKNIVKQLDDNKCPEIICYFAHQETVMPLMSLLKVPGCDYTGNDWNAIKNHVQDFNLSPMAANIQFTIYKATSGKMYLRCDVNEHIVPILPNDNREYTPLNEAIKYFKKRCK